MNQEFKAECLFTLMRVRRWQFALLADLDFPRNGEREYEFGVSLDIDSEGESWGCLT